MAMRLRKFNFALQLCRKFSAKVAEGQASHSHESAATWRNAFLFLGLPAVAAVYYYAFYVQPQHPERPEFVPYPHLRLRNRKYPWGDGNKTLFHNPYYNALPEGYEEGSEELHPAKHHH